jgi:hypothetical protein
MRWAFLSSPYTSLHVESDSVLLWIDTHARA